MSKYNIVDSINYLDNFCYELLHSENDVLKVGGTNFLNDELNANIKLLTQYMKFIIDKKIRE